MTGRPVDWTWGGDEKMPADEIARVVGCGNADERGRAMTPRKKAWDRFVYDFAKSLGVVRLVDWLAARWRKR